MRVKRALLETLVSASADPSTVLVMPGSSSAPGCCCCCCDLPLSEDTARFLLLAIFMLGYLLCGAAIFSALEHPLELQNQQRWHRTLAAASQKFNVSPVHLHGLLKEYELAMAAGVRMDALRPRWDFPGAFYFVSTVVSTIGYGLTTPATTIGKAFLVFYGMLGCSGTILFFNLFLERLITLLGAAMRAFRLHQLRSRGVFPRFPGQLRRQEEECWKPSVYTVMLILAVSAIAISCTASAIYSPAEGWRYLDSLYFCFVTFSTIGFGDLVSGQRHSYEQPALYGLGNFLFILLGVCCIYSLFNVISIAIKQALNWLLCCCSCWQLHHRRKHRVTGPTPARPPRSEVSADTEAVFESEAEVRHMSLEMSAIRDFIAASSSPSPTTPTAAATKTSGVELGNGHLRVAWRDLANSFKGSGSLPTHKGCELVEFGCQKGILDDIGSLAVMNNKLAETSSVAMDSSIDYELQTLPASSHHIQRHFPGLPATIEETNRLCQAGSSGMGSLADIGDGHVLNSTGESGDRTVSSGVGSSLREKAVEDVEAGSVQRLSEDPDSELLPKGLWPQR
uniref:Potassium channel subfamily K member 13-like isoform X1 n=1 Tax=Geotrypetes seraphini TaxID=260995 RepID=A0A6P8S3T0_GEOSA|nr:potassium channel subfamily K member 13-like isoform X1 [Geotrypetes seraphini]XP_033812569.1 potassium channel subfamily K member 13-like isoform X1 [Geotrypetes seraphini]XP_033812570.1 potassium channel subfamily K member 13-like isoform X1 [Geotrypetes seraphini]XP_033812571.1 potassium channel subfamily K member 13-like isoform X1 [Geotrypetes seraphini]XP_033812572.1 potassium channel subfamily K member 13-like isoform X1 [Geotrypetes seraphini]